MGTQLTHDFRWGTAHRWEPSDLYSSGQIIALLMSRGDKPSISSGTGDECVLSIKQGLGELLVQPGEWIVADPTLGGRSSNLHVFSDARFTVMVAAAILRFQSDENFSNYDGTEIMSYVATVNLSDTMRMCAWTWKTLHYSIRSSMLDIANSIMISDRPAFLSAASKV